jgi:hypothetical protein
VSTPSNRLEAPKTQKVAAVIINIGPFTICEGPYFVTLDFVLFVFTFPYLKIHSLYFLNSCQQFTREAIHEIVQKSTL